MTDPSLFLRWGEFEAGAYGCFAITALLIIFALAAWRRIT